MKALMSEELREIIRDRKSNEALERGISELSSGCESAKFSAAGNEYVIKFVQGESKPKQQG